MSLPATMSLPRHMSLPMVKILVVEIDQDEITVTGAHQCDTMSAAINIIKDAYKAATQTELPAYYVDNLLKGRVFRTSGVSYEGSYTQFPKVYQIIQMPL